MYKLCTGLEIFMYRFMYTHINIYVQIMYGPSWVVEPSDQAGQEREQVQLICLADSNPNPR